MAEEKFLLENVKQSIPALGFVRHSWGWVYNTENIGIMQIIFTVETFTGEDPITTPPLFHA